MNFDDAINAHAQWKVRLRRLLDGTSNETIDAETVARDNVCVLGQWLYGEGSKYSAHPAYAKLKNEHASFHKCAGQVVRFVAGGNKAAAEATLDSNGEFSQRSIHVVLAIRELKRQAAVAV